MYIYMNIYEYAYIYTSIDICCMAHFVVTCLIFKRRDAFGGQV